MPGTRPILPALMRGLPAAGAMVCVGPPLLASAPSCGSTPNARLLPLVPDRVNPVLLPMALKFAFTVVPVTDRMSGPLALMFPETTELTTVIEPGVVLIRATPPPPVLAAEALDVLLTTVLPCTTMEPLPVVTTAAPPDRAAVFPVSVLFWSSKVPAKDGIATAPPFAAELLFARVLLRMTTVPGVNPAPAGGELLAVPKKYRAPPPTTVPLAVFPEMVLFSTVSPPPLKKYSAPPSAAAVLPLSVLFLTVRKVPEFMNTAPPLPVPVTVLVSNRELITVTLAFVPVTCKAPPLVVAVFPVNVTPLRLIVVPAALAWSPPPVAAFPPEMVIPLIVRADAVESKTRKFPDADGSRRTVRLAAPVPGMVSGPTIVGKAESREMVRGVLKKPGSKTIVSGPGTAFASPITCRRLPNPESASLNTVKFGIAMTKLPTDPAGMNSPSTSATCLANTLIVYVPESMPSHDPPGGVKEYVATRGEPLPELSMLTYVSGALNPFGPFT